MSADRRLRLHPLNSGFSWHARGGPFRRVSKAQMRLYDECGCFVLEDAFTAEEIAAVTAKIDPFEARVEAALRRVDGGRVFIARADEITFTVHLAALSARLRAFVSSPVFRDLCADLVGPDVRLYWDQAVYKKPGTKRAVPVAPGQRLHVHRTAAVPHLLGRADGRDAGQRLPVDRAGRAPGRHARPSAHRPRLVCLEDAPDAVPVPARAGSIVVFSSLTPHSTGPNRSDAVRKAYIVQFAPDGARVVRNDDAVGALPAGLANHPDWQFPSSWPAAHRARVRSSKP